MNPSDFEDCFGDQPARPALADDLEQAQRLRGGVLRRRAWAGGLATAVGVTVTAVVVGTAAPASTQTAVPAAPPASARASADPSASATPAAEPTSDYPTRDQIAAQQRVDKALEPMSKIVKNDGADDPHYAGSSVSIEDQTATIYWKGTVPKIIRDLEGTTATGVRVSVVPAAYSQHDAGVAAKKLFAASRRGDLPNVKSSGLSNTGDVLVVGFSRADLASYGEQELSRQLRAITDLRFRLTEGRDIHGEVVLPGYQPLSEATVAALRSRGTELTVVQSDRSADAAVKAAGASADKRPDGVSLARVTVQNYAEVSSTDPDATGKLLIQDRLVWVVVFGKQRQYVSQPAPAPGQPSPSALYQVVSTAVLIDAGTNKFLYGETFG